jgi:hypothetical protein
MTVLSFLAFFALAGGLLILLKIFPIQLLTDVSGLFAHRKVKMKKQIRRSRKPRKLRGIRRIVRESRDVLRITNRNDRFPTICLISLLLFLLGILISGMLSNPFLMPVLAVGFSLLPFLYVLFSATRFQKELNGELETALSIITSSYIRSNSLLLAVEENIEYLHSPVREVFEKFYTQASMIDADLPGLLDEMKDSINNSMFQEWCAAMILCQDDRNLKTTLTPVVDKLSDIRIVTGELENLLYEPLKEILMMSALLILNIPLIRSQSAEWYHTLMYSIPGQIVLAICAFVLFLSLIGVIRETQPIDYRR